MRTCKVCCAGKLRMYMHLQTIVLQGLARLKQELLEFENQKRDELARFEEYKKEEIKKLKLVIHTLIMPCLHVHVCLKLTLFKFWRYPLSIHLSHTNR